MRGLLFLTIIYLVNIQSLTAQKILIVSDRPDEYLLNTANISVFKDSSGKMDYKSVLKKPFSLPFIDSETPDFKTSNFWLRITVKNTSSDSKWLLEILDFGIQNVAFYDIEKDSLIETGYSRNFNTRVYKHKNFVFDLSVPPGKTQSYLLRLSSSFSFGPTMKVRSCQRFNSYANNEYLLLGFYYGLLILIALYNVFLFISIREVSYLYYVLYVLSVGLRSLEWDGLGFQYLWPSFPQLNYGLHFAPQLLLISFSAYSIRFLELRNNYKYYYRIVLASLALYFLLFFMDIIFPMKYINRIYVIPFFMIYGISIIIYLKGYKSVRFFVLGYSLLIFTQLLNLSMSLGFYLENEILIIFLFVYSINIVFVTEVFIFSVALADKIKIFKKEKETARQLIIDQLTTNEKLKDKVNRELELKVSERTKELEGAKMKLEEQAEQINNMNRMLDIENYKLKNDVKEITIERGLLKALSFEEFTNAFPDESSCYRFIEELKWGDSFACYKCGNLKYITGKDMFTRRCTRCGYIETIKANTIFHHLKFPVEKAFQMIYLTLTSEEDISTYELAGKMKLQQKTCWSFRQKILDKIKKEHISKKDLMEKGWSILIKSD